ncbi:xerD [Acrasis kona]|uniref:XerD n=1 Tax=Acrasis kona TaxID=1008807 RepID=A0AAW2Z817_9EUKA
MSPLPASPLLIEYYMYHMADSKRGASVKMFLAACRFYHLSNNLANPTDCDSIKLAAKNCNKEWLKTRKVLRRDPFPLIALTHYCAHRPCDTSEFEYRRNIALISNCFRGMMRAGEIVKCCGKSIEYEDENTVLVWDLGKTKTDKEGVDSRVPIDSVADSPACPVSSMIQYEKTFTTQFGQRFTKQKHLFVHENGKPLTTDDVREIVQQMIRFAGRKEVCGAHSLRSGGATLAAKAGLSLEEIMAIGRWKSECVHRYIRALVGVGKKLSTLMFKS